jgi:hypothetical protein
MPTTPTLPTTPAMTMTPAAGDATPVLLGRPDWAGYCAATGQGQLLQIYDNAYGWRCTADNGMGNDANDVCAWTYKSDQVTNRVEDFNNPHSWQCWRATRLLGLLDFDAYCKKLGHSGARYVQGLGAYGWFCTGSGGGIDTQDACRRLYGVDPPVSRFQNFYDGTTWQCWG